MYIHYTCFQILQIISDIKQIIILDGIDYSAMYVKIKNEIFFEFFHVFIIHYYSFIYY